MKRSLNLESVYVTDRLLADRLLADDPYERWDLLSQTAELLGSDDAGPRTRKAIEEFLLGGETRSFRDKDYYAHTVLLYVFEIASRFR